MTKTTITNILIKIGVRNYSLAGLIKFINKVKVWKHI